VRRQKRNILLTRTVPVQKGLLAELCAILPCRKRSVQCTRADKTDKIKYKESCQTCSHSSARNVRSWKLARRPSWACQMNLECPTGLLPVEGGDWAENEDQLPLSPWKFHGLPLMSQRKFQHRATLSVTATVQNGVPRPPPPKPLANDEPVLGTGTVNVISTVKQVPLPESAKPEAPATGILHRRLRR
jgi:hypothetical protein